MERLNVSQLIAVCVFVMTISTCAKADTSYTPAPSSGGPYPASGVPESDAGTSSAKAKANANVASYQPSSWKPAGRLLVLPLRPASAAVASTKKCVTTHGKTATATAAESEFGTEDSATSPKPEPESENINESAVNSQQQIPVVPDSGIYYVLLPDGRLQKVTYSTMPLLRTPSKLQNNNAAATAAAENEVLNGYAANVKYQDVEPVRGPIYAYSAAPLIRIFK